MLVGGTDRVRLYLSKFVVLALALFGYSLAGVALITLFAALVNGWGGTFEWVQLIRIGGVALRITLLNLVYGALLAGVAILTKSTGIVIAIGIGLQFAEGLITTVVQLVDNPIIDFLTRLIPSGYVIPFSALTVKTPMLLQGIAVSFVLIAVFLAIGIRLFRRQDISA
jgi:ABC-type transport system involved in multi-copper enzyme maturation permease subunit